MRYPHRETPTPRINPSRKKVWIARVTNPKGKRIIYKPAWNGGKGTFKLERDAQRAIDEYYDITYGQRIVDHEKTFGDYHSTWAARRPRSERTNEVNDGRVRNLLDVEIEGLPLRDWPFRELERRHGEDLVHHMLVVEGRAVGGVQGILSTLSAMAENAITDRVAGANWAKGIRVLSNDVRCRKAPRKPIVWSFERMHAFAAFAEDPAVVHGFSDTGMRIGEVLPLERTDLVTGHCPEPDCYVNVTHFHIRRTAHNGKVQQGTKNDHGEAVAGRVAPCPPTLERLLAARPTRIDTPLMFPTPNGGLYWERNFLRDVWYPTQVAHGLAEVARAGVDIARFADLPRQPRGQKAKALYREARELLVAHKLTPTPHAFRHSYVSHLKAAGVDQADLAQVAGHTVQTMVGHYTHATGRSFDQIRQVIG